MENKVLKRLVEERDRVHETIDDILDAASSEERDPSDAERDLLTRNKARLDQLEPQIGELVELEERRNGAVDARAYLTRNRRETPEPEGDEDGDEGDEGGEGEPEYRTFGQYARDELLVRFDKAAQLAGPGQRQRASERLTRAKKKLLTRAPAQVLTADVPGLTGAQHIAQIQQVIDRSRPLVDAANRIGLQAGSLSWPRITNRPDVAVQATQKTEAGDGAMTVVMDSQAADTYIVAANFAWQTLQWSNPDALSLWFDLAAASYAQKTDAAVAALLAGLDTVPVVVAAGGTLEDYMVAIASASAEVYANTGRYADTIAADPASGFALLGLVSATSPVFVATGGGSFTGSFPAIGGLRFVVSSGLPAKTMMIGDFAALLCAETPGSPVELRAIEPAIGGIEVGIIGAFAAAVTDAGSFAEVTTP